LLLQEHLLLLQLGGLRVRLLLVLRGQAAGVAGLLSCTASGAA
jgi:hypothetical protein